MLKKAICIHLVQNALDLFLKRDISWNETLSILSSIVENGKGVFNKKDLII